ncbi:MAG: MmcQ/YjbR family DNA-binding protein [Hyphomicrobiaceae bacterium]|nr:MmcQ/YjbR family DNA-binding protein [Hyphomicrobiaceae bacterium]
MGAHVWKVGIPGEKTSKVFAIARQDEGDETPRVTFKVSDIGYEILRDAPGCIPAPHLASRGMKWIQWRSPETLSWDALLEHIAESHALVVPGLTKAVRRSVGLLAAE